MSLSQNEKLKKLVLMLSSDQDGEVLSAVRMIGAHLQAQDMDWHDFAEHAAKVIPTPRAAVRRAFKTETEWRYSQAGNLWRMAGGVNFVIMRSRRHGDFSIRITGSGGLSAYKNHFATEHEAQMYADANESELIELVE